MKRKLQVFISSTYTDMRDERQAAVEAILSAGHIPAGMELFAASDESQLATIYRWIDDSDVFMLILGGRYGSIEPKSKKSYIELEYEYAASKKKPLFAAVIDNAYLEAKIRDRGSSATESTYGEKLAAFRKTVTEKMCRFFEDTKDLKLIVLESLLNYDKYEWLLGWVRGSEVVDLSATLREVSRLQAENALLRGRVESPEADQQPSAASLSDDARELLVAAESGDGHILYAQYMGGASLQVENRNFIEPAGSDREEARWKAALDELIEQELAEAVGHKGEVFHLTKRGYKLADVIKAAGSPVSLTIEYDEIGIESKRHDYQLQVVLKNEGTSDITEWHVDVVFPTALLDPSARYALAVPERSDHKDTLFRSSQETLPGVIYPGDEKTVMTIDYYIDSNIYRLRWDLFQGKARAISFIGGQQVASAEKSVSELQNF